MWPETCLCEKVVRVMERHMFSCYGQGEQPTEPLQSQFNATSLSRSSSRRKPGTNHPKERKNSWLHNLQRRWHSQQFPLESSWMVNKIAMFGKTELVKLTRKLHNCEFDSKFKHEQEKVNRFPVRRNVHPAPKSSARKTPCYLLIYFFENNLKNHDPKKNTFGRSLDSR